MWDQRPDGAIRRTYSWLLSPLIGAAWGGIHSIFDAHPAWNTWCAAVSAAITALGLGVAVDQQLGLRGAYVNKHLQDEIIGGIATRKPAVFLDVARFADIIAAATRPAH